MRHLTNYNQTIEPSRMSLMSEKILIVEDEALIADSLEYALQKEGYQVITAADGVQGLVMAREQAPDLMILDIMLPGMSGFDVCRTIRGESSMPIMMLTAKTEEIDRVVGLELGADDYVIKPFSMREVIARVKAVLRRTQMQRDKPKEEAIRAGDLVVDCRRRVVRVRGKVLHLPLKEFELIYTLVKNRDTVLTREMLLNSVWKGEAYEDTRTLDVHIHWLREKIEDDPSSPKRVVTVRGVGYMFVGQDDDQQD